MEALRIAADSGDLQEVRRLVEQENVPIDQADEWGDTPLHSAVAQGRFYVVEYLLKKGADPNVPNKAGSTALHKGAIAKYEQGQILRTLLSSKADPMKRNGNGLLPEQLAVSDTAKTILAGEDIVTEKLFVPRAKHGRIIGKKGMKMKEIQSESGAHVTVPKPEKPSNDEASASKADEKPVRGRHENDDKGSKKHHGFDDKANDTIVIKGRKEAVEKAKKLILELVSGGDREETSGDGDRPSTKYHVPKDKHRLIIGRGGATINEIREEANVEIIIPPANSGDEDIIIRGYNFDNISLAIKSIQKITGSTSAAPSGARRGSGGNFGGGGRNTPEGGSRGRISTPESGSSRGGNRGGFKRE